MQLVKIVALICLVAFSPLSAADMPFGSRPQSYAPGTLKPSPAHDVMDRAIVRYYEKWKAAYLVPIEGGRRHWRAIRSLEASHPFVAEAQGYGLEIFAYLAGADPAAQECFDAVLDYILDHPSAISPGLMAAEQRKDGKSVNGSDSATDGDITIAYGLLLADRQWGSKGAHDYKALALARIAAIKKSEINPVTKLPLLGDWSSTEEKTYYDVRLSDLIVDHFRAFRATTRDPFWDEVIAATQKLITHLQKNFAPQTGLVPDFAVKANTADPRPAPPKFLEDKNDGEYSYNATRVPWRLGTDAAVFGDPASLAQVRRFNDWIRRKTDGDPAKIQSGYTLSGQALDEDSDPIFSATFGPAALHADQAWLDALWTLMANEAAHPKITDYYGASLLLQSMIVVSGNYWTPAK